MNIKGLLLGTYLKEQLRIRHSTFPYMKKPTMDGSGPSGGLNCLDSFNAMMIGLYNPSCDFIEFFGETFLDDDLRLNGSGPTRNALINIVSKWAP